MSHFDSSWMSCRPTHSRSSHISLLPQFSVPPGVTDFAIERKPPHLPPRNSPSWLCVMGIVLVLCIVGSYSTMSGASEPTLQHRNSFVSGVTSVVEQAISRANVQAEKHAQQHYEAREEYMNRRKLSRRSLGSYKAPHAGAPPPARAQQPAPELALDSHDVSASATPKPELLSRMAALGKAGALRIDDSAVEQFFPAWVAHRSQNQWDENAVLRDLVLAVSQLADKPTPGNEGLPEDAEPKTSRSSNNGDLGLA